jgi:hypothetical protein
MAWNGLCPAGKHGLDHEGQACDLCPKTFGIGSKVWTADSLRREPVREYTVVSETRASWVTNVGTKLAKKAQPGKEAYRVVASRNGYGSTCYWLDRAAMEEHLWMQRNGWRVGDAVRGVQDPKVLREVARLIGYEERD